MKKVALAVLILVDLVILAGAGAFLFWHLNGGAPVSLPGASMLGTSSSRTPSAPAHPFTATSLPMNTTASATTPITPSAPVATSQVGIRHIQFTYRNPKAQQVSIRADFTGWKAESMKKEPKGVWTYNASLQPGEYAYCYTADDKTFRDPANKRTKQIGRTYVSSIVVAPLSSAPKR